MGIPKWLCKILSYMAVFLYGGYTYSHFHGNSVELHHWILTGLFGIFFYVGSLPDKK